MKSYVTNLLEKIKAKKKMFINYQVSISPHLYVFITEKVVWIFGLSVFLYNIVFTLVVIYNPKVNFNHFICSKKLIKLYLYSGFFLKLLPVSITPQKNASLLGFLTRYISIFYIYLLPKSQEPLWGFNLLYISVYLWLQKFFCFSLKF